MSNSFRTGDSGYLDDLGYLHITRRHQEMTTDGGGADGDEDL